MGVLYYSRVKKKNSRVKNKNSTTGCWESEKTSRTITINKKVLWLFAVYANSHLFSTNRHPFRTNRLNTVIREVKSFKPKGKPWEAINNCFQKQKTKKSNLFCWSKAHTLDHRQVDSKNKKQKNSIKFQSPPTRSWVSSSTSVLPF